MKFQTAFRLTIFCILTLASNYGFAQLEGSAFSAAGRGGTATTFATDYQTIGINPANLGIVKDFRDPFVTFGFFENSASIFSEALTSKELVKTVFDRNANNEPFTFFQKQQAATKFTDKTMSVNMDVMTFGASIRIKKKLGLAFSSNERLSFRGRLGQDAADIAFKGGNSPYFKFLNMSDGSVINNDANLTEEQRLEVLSGFNDNTIPNNPDIKTYAELLNGTSINATWTREYNLALGLQVFDSYDFSAYVGIGGKLIRGYTYFNLESSPDASGNPVLKADIAMSPDFGFDPTQTISEPVDVKTLSLYSAQPIAIGFGTDLGASFVIKKNFHFGMSVNNIGSLTWNNSTYNIADGNLVQINGQGFDSYNILTSSPNSFDLGFGGSTNSPFTYSAESSITNQLPTTLRIGGSYEYYRTLHIGFDMIKPLNTSPNSLLKTLYGIGLDFRPNKLFKLSTGLTLGGNFGNKINIPIGIVYSGLRSFYEAGFAIKDITFLANTANGSNLAFSTGFLRFKF